LPIGQSDEDRLEIHCTRIYRAVPAGPRSPSPTFLAGSVRTPHQDGLLDPTVIHGDGTTAAGRKASDNPGNCGHKYPQSDKVAAFDRLYNVSTIRVCPA